MAQREAQDMAAALGSIAEAAIVAPNDLRIALVHAHIAYECWQPAAELFARAAELHTAEAPAHLAITRSRAQALNAEGEWCAAQALLRDTLASHPGWIDGHRALATLCVTGGMEEFDTCFAEAIAVQPANLALRLAWFHMLATARLWDKARAVLGDAQTAFGEPRALRLAHAFFLAESGEGGHRTDLFDALGDVQDVGLDLARTRHALRIGQPEAALAIAMPHSRSPAARSFWPYISLAWRLIGDPRVSWLDGSPVFIGYQDDVLTVEECTALAATLRRLLVLQAPYLEQSVRGGVQTDRHLFFNPDPLIQHLRIRVRDAVGRYVANLPPPEKGHPLLGQVRDDVRFEGSWSVLLRKQGFHSNHTHNMGWISSAFYVQLPPPDKLGPSPAGWLSHGTPPPELGLGLPAYGYVEPKVGRLALFPSTMWHGTVPFDDGERLTVAFDVKLPAVLQG
jgi:hypothetical protein